MGITQLDLSPFYLQKASDNMDYWRQRRGGSNPADSVAHKDKFLQAPAEEIPVADASYDIVSPAFIVLKLYSPAVTPQSITLSCFVCYSIGRGYTPINNSAYQ